MYTYFPGFIATPTKIRNFLECPRKFWYYHINPETKNKQAERSYFTLGHHVHSALDNFFKTPLEMRKKEMLITEFNKAWESHHGPTAGFKTPEEEKEAKERGEAMLKRFLEKEDWHAVPISLPETSSMIPGYQQVGIDKELAFGGVIDRLDKDADGVLHIIDYKTGKSDKGDEWQLSLYAVLVGRLLKTFVGRTSYLFLDHDKRETRENSIEDNLETIKRVSEVVAQIPKSKLKEDFVCKDGEDCRHCNYLLEIGYDPKTGQKLDDATAPQEDAPPDLPF